MSHDPLCLNDWLVTERCNCVIIAKAREDMLAKCIAAVQQALDKFWEESDADELGWLEQHELYVAALRALQEKP
jgi:hypothetical protein